MADGKNPSYSEDLHEDAKDYGGDWKNFAADADEDDVWAKFLHHITGYPMPSRSELFEDLTSPEGGPLFRMDFQEHDVNSVLKTGLDTNKNQDYDIWFFTKDGKKLKQARIVFEGSSQSDDGTTNFTDNSGADTAADVAVDKGAEFSDYNDDKFSQKKLREYMNGPRDALLALQRGDTSGVVFNSARVKDQPVNLDSLDDTANAFDRVSRFFENHSETIKGWEDALTKDEAVWKGESADIFVNLLKKARKNYEGYVDTFTTSGTGEGSGNTVYAKALQQAKKDVKETAGELIGHWKKWAQSDYYDPLRVLANVLHQLAVWVDENNVSKVTLHTTTSWGGYGPAITTTRAETDGGFTTTHPKYGDLEDKENWKKVGEEAVRIWNAAVDDYLGEPSRDLQSKLNNSFADLSDDFSDNQPTPKTTSSASEDYNNKGGDSDDKAQDEIDKMKEDYEKEIDKLKDGYEEQLDKQEEAYKEQIDDLKNDMKDQRDEFKDQLNEQEENFDKERDKYEDHMDKMQEEFDEQLNEGLGNLNGNNAGPGTLNFDNLNGGNDLGGLNGGNAGPGTLNFDNLNGGNDLGGSNGGNAGPGTLNFDNLNEGPPTSSTESVLGGQDILGNGGENNGGGLNQESGAHVMGALNGPGGANQSPNQNQRNNNVDEQLSKLEGLNGGGPGGDTGLETPTGGQTSLTGDGNFETSFPDGSQSVFDPDTGELTSSGPDGESTADLKHGASVLNPDGSTTSLKDGQLTTEWPDGTTQSIDPDTGEATTKDPEGKTTTENLGSLNGGQENGGLGGLGDLGNNLDQPLTESVSNLDGLNSGGLGGDGLETPTGGQTSLTEGGDLATTFPDGSQSVFDPDSGELTSSGPGGESTTDLKHGANVQNPDGSTTSLKDGQLTTEWPDGTTQRINPDTNIATTTDPEGNTTTTDLAGLNSGSNGGLDGLDGLGSRNTGNLGDIETQVPDLNGAGGGGGGGSTSSLDTDLPGNTASTSAGNGLFDGVGADGGGAGSDAPGGGGTSGQGAGQQPAGAGGAPMMPPMGGMGGMGGGGAGDKGNSERVRAVLHDAAEESKRRQRRRRSGWGRGEDEDTFLTQRPATTGGRTENEGSEGSAEAPRTSTSSGDYLEEDEDVWGTDDGGAPAVIGR
ncbi:AAWKG family protein [Streptomyces sulphureus]|uniref:AAWKG family protein n=1 Tax=Streptomyces sulphureus TaxID=47758 RepID=UPI000366B389|nr:AAWKG family protein [Streptomyces sulphureus]